MAVWGSLRALELSLQTGEASSTRPHKVGMLTILHDDHSLRVPRCERVFVVARASMRSITRNGLQKNVSDAPSALAAYKVLACLEDVQAEQCGKSERQVFLWEAVKRHQICCVCAPSRPAHDACHAQLMS